MKVCTSLLVLSLLGLSHSQSVFERAAPRDHINKNPFGHYEIVDTQHDGSIKKQVHFNPKEYERDYVAQTEFLKKALNQIKGNEQQILDGSIYKCSDKPGNDNVLEFFPLYVGEIGGLKSHHVPFSQGRCFQNIDFTYERIDAGQGKGKFMKELQITIKASNPATAICSDIFFFGTAEFQHLEEITQEGQTTLVFKNINVDGMMDVGKNGIKIFMFCSGYVDIFTSLWKTVLAFFGGLSPDPDLPIIGSHVPPYMEEANIEFLKEAMHYEMEVRDTQKVEIDPDYIQSGDFIAILRLDGLDPMIMYGTGGHAGHTVMALRMDGELYIVESQDGWYWPVHGIQKNKWSDWIKYAENADFQVVHMPLNAKQRARFNEAAAIEFFKETEGLPYGYHNFLFGWLDTADLNFPPLLPAKLVPIAFSMMEELDPDTIDIFFGQAINHRLGTKGLKIQDLTYEAAKRDLTLMDVAAMPEKEGWVYEGIEPRDGISYVCSAYVAAMYKRAGLFGDLEINAPEFVPRDIYTLNFFEADPEKRPDACKKADPGQPFCQLLGKYRMTFPGLNSIDPYPKMAQSCPSQPPYYYRPDYC